MSYYSDFYEPSPFDDYEELPQVECKYCGSEGVYWEETANGWRLFNEADDTLHDCRSTASADDFDDLE